ncbi:hypothetical protein VaNZ11_016065 [Volvox africanus]|uniref:Protein kinase domain-containing protein n=1 Tax=Volvox africanus TaxID=51714 RepID=A0ABQ5SNG5_9CHLO|nr:hypothetical protein VaNZ11_016065 [Volvox africanus]
MVSSKGRKDEVAALTADQLRSQLVLKKMVGKGGFAAVYLGTYNGQEVAVKVILAEHVNPESLQVKLLLREGQYMSRCTHRNIVKCHAVCQLPADFPGIEALGHRTSTWALVLEYIGGGSLAALMMKQMSQTRKAYTEYEAYCWIRGIAGALSYLHNAPRPVMHRDVKADNVLLTQDESGEPVAKLMDFGLMAALDGKNPLLRRRSVSASNGGDGLGRTSSTPTGGGGARNLSVPSVATYYNDSTHEPGKIFYLMDELPAPTVAALVGPAVLRRISVDFNGRNLGASLPSPFIATPGTSTPGGMASSAAQYGVVSRGNSFDSSAAAAAAALGTGASAIAGGNLAWGPKVRSALAPATPGSFGTLVPLSEEASYHGNTAGYAAMLLQQQQQRQQQQRQRRVSQDAAAAAGSAAAMACAAAGATSGSSAPNSMHGAAGRPDSCSGGSPPAGISSLWAVSPQPGVSPLRPPSPAMNWPADELTPGSVRLRLLADDHGVAGTSAPVAAGGSGDSAIAAAVAARLNRQVPERNGCLVRMSAPQPSLLSAPPTGAVLLEDESSPEADPGCTVVPDLAAATCSSSAASNIVQQQPPAKHPDECHSLLHPPLTLQPLQLRVSRPSSAIKLPPIIAVAKHPLPAAATAAASSAAAEAARGGGPSTATASGGAAGVTDNTAAPPPSVGGSRDDTHGLAVGNNFNGERRASLHDAVPLVGIDVGADGVVISGTGRRSRAGMLHPGTQPAAVAAAALSGVHAQVVTPPLSLGEAGGSGGGGGGGGAVSSTNPRFDRQSSQKSIGSNRSGTGNGYVSCGTADGTGPATGGALSPTGASNGGQLSIAALLQGRYEQDFQWVWRLTGQTGSCMYMAPEVHRNMPYNEKVDVFSFGVLMYEVFSRTLLLVAALNLRELRLKGMDTPEGYAQYVAEGYRPPKPLAMPDALYELISACWADDPCARPNMTEVVESLRILQAQYAPEPTSSAPSCRCVVS